VCVGFYCHPLLLLLQSGGKNIRVTAMNNLLPSTIEYHEKYDLKVTDRVIPLTTCRSLPNKGMHIVHPFLVSPYKHCQYNSSASKTITIFSSVITCCCYPQGSSYKRFASSSEVAKKHPTFKDIDFHQRHPEVQCWQRVWLCVSHDLHRVSL